MTEVKEDGPLRPSAHLFHPALNPKTLNPRPQTLNPKTLNPKLEN